MRSMRLFYVVALLEVTLKIIEGDTAHERSRATNVEPLAQCCIVIVPCMCTSCRDSTNSLKFRGSLLEVFLC